MMLIGANTSARIVGLDRLPVKSNYFIGNDPTEWQTEVPSYSRVKYEGVYPGIDLVFYGNQTQLEYDFILAPGATPEVIRLKFDGAGGVSLDAAGSLVLETEAGAIRQHNPTVYQEINGAREKVDCSYLLDQPDQIGFRVGSFDATKPLVIDPILSYATFLGGDNQELGNDVAVDSDGNVYITGTTWSADFPLVSALQPARRGNAFSDAFVAKLNPSGTALIYSTYLGGDNADEASRIAVDPSGNAYVIGSSGSGDFPTTPGSLQPAKTTLFGNFVAKISAGGDMLSYSTFFGGGGLLGDIAVDRIGNAYLTGAAVTDGFPTTAGAFQTTSRGNVDAFVARLNSSGTSLVYSTYLGGRDFDFCQSITLDSTGNAYVTGYTLSLDFPTTSGAFQRMPPPEPENFSDAFVTKLNPSGSALVYSTFIAGSRTDSGRGIAIDEAGFAYITGETNSLDFPTTAKTLQTQFSGGLLKSNNGGDRWRTSNTGFKNPDISALAIDPRTPSTVYAAAGSSVFKSTDKGSRWVPTNPPDFTPEILVVDPANPLVLYAGSFVGPIHKSTDGGMTWRRASAGLSANFRLFSLLVDQKNPSILYAAGADNSGLGQASAGPGGGLHSQPPPPTVWRLLFISTDAGLSWVESPSIGLPRAALFALTQDSKTNSLYVSAGGLLHKSSDGGISWRNLNLNHVTSLVIDPSDSATLYAGVQAGVSLFKSRDGGENWTPMDTGIPSETPVFALAIDPKTPTTIFAGTFDGVFKSTDGASSWTPTLISGEIKALALDPSDPDTVYAAVRDPSDAFLTKLSPGGDSVIYSTLLGGRNRDAGFGIAVSPAGSAYVTGETFSAYFPTMAAMQANKGATYAGFITKLNASGDAFIYSTYLGGGQSLSGNGTTANGIALGASGVVYVVGESYNPDFPTLNALQPVFGGGHSDCFLAKFVEPRIDRVSVEGKDMIVRGEFFDPDAVVILNGTVRKTAPDPSTPTTTLIASKAGKKIKPGKALVIQVRNSNGEVSEPFLFAPRGPGIASRGLRIEESRVAGLHACLPFAEIRRFEARYWQSPVCRLAQRVAYDAALARL